MTKILITSDIHGRSFWKEPCNNWEGKIIFLGDYHDPYEEYVDGEPDKAVSLTKVTFSSCAFFCSYSLSSASAFD